MWHPPINFTTLHYAWILFMGLLAIPVMYPYGNMSAMDSYFFGASSSTESGLNTVDLKELKLYQQLYLYFIPMFTNLGFINIMVVVVRIFWFNKRLDAFGPALLRAKRRRAASDEDVDLESTDVNEVSDTNGGSSTATDLPSDNSRKDAATTEESGPISPTTGEAEAVPNAATDAGDPADKQGPRIAFAPSANKSAHPKNDGPLYIPGPRERDRGQPFLELTRTRSEGGDDLDMALPTRSQTEPGNEGPRRRRFDTERLKKVKSVERAANVATSMFVIGNVSHQEPRLSRVSTSRRAASDDMPYLSRRATIGRNSKFYNLTHEDRAELGGIEYRSLKLLLKIVVSYFFGLHILGAIGLVGWIQNANPKYAAYLQQCGQNKNWWAFYTAQSVIDNLGFTLTPDSMVFFQDAEWPMFFMSFLAFAGNTLYPVFLRLIIWIMSKIVPKKSQMQESLNFLLNHPRRCYTLLFPRGTTWALFGIIFVLNFFDALFIVVLDLDNKEVKSLPPGPRVLASIFQAASSRHTGMAAFNLGNVSPGVQFSLLVMMYISAFPIAMSIRASNTYEEKSLGVYETDASYNEERGGAYLVRHLQSQLSFDLWYIFLGIFCLSISESSKISDPQQPSFALFPLFFEVVSAYGNVGLSLGYPGINASLSAKFTTFGQLVICAMMIRGRHRGLPYTLDRAIMLPDEHLVRNEVDSNTKEQQDR